MEQDIQTLSAVLIILCFGYAIGFFAVSSGKTHYRGMGWWSVALVMEGVGFLLLALQGVIVPLLSVVVANTLIVAGFMTIIVGINTFYGNLIPWAVRSLLFLGLFSGFIYYFTFVSPSMNARVVTVSGALGVMALATAYHLYRRTLNVMRPVAYFVLSGFMLFAIYYLMRAWEFWNSPVVDAVRAVRMHETTLIVFIALIGWYSFGFILMTFYRNSMDLYTIMKIDALTGAYLRHALFEILTDEMQRAERNDRPLCVVMMDLDFFKRLNDSLGHVVGDEALRLSVKKVLSSIRIFDKIGRYGGEEFIVVLPETERETAIKVAERLRLAVASITVGSGLKARGVTASFGVTQFIPGDTPERLVERVDHALYQAKASGRNCVVAG